jgi:dienelactone hydrolase
VLQSPLSAFPRFIGFLTVLALGLLTPQLQASTLWGNLQPGPYSVGYKTIFTFDLSRPAITRDALGRERIPVRRGRQMQISVWYPTSRARHQSFIRFEEYVYLLSQELDFAPLTIKQREQSIQSFMKEPLAKGAARDQLQALMKMKTGAIKDATSARGKFPLVVYAHIAPAGNNIMCEYLASHGFVVAAIPWKGTFEYNLDVGLTGVETQIKDLEFAIGLLRGASNVDGEKVAAIGMSFGAISVLGLQTRNSEVDALISLDGGIGSAFGAGVVQRTPYYSLSRITVPLLHLYGQKVPGTDLTYLDTLKYSTRYLVGFPGMRHADFVNQGMFEHFVPGIDGKPAGDTRTGFEWACRYTLHFLKAYLKGDSQSLSMLSNSPEANGIPKGVLTVERKPDLKAPPSAGQLQTLIEGKGVQGLVRLYTELKEKDSQPLPQQTLSDVGRWLGEKGDWQSARAVADIRLDSYPKSAWANYAAAEVYRRLGDKERAKQLYHDALRLLPGDFDPEIDFNRRRGIYEGARRNLESSND